MAQMREDVDNNLNADGHSIDGPLLLVVTMNNDPPMNNDPLWWGIFIYSFGVCDGMGLIALSLSK